MSELEATQIVPAWMIRLAVRGFAVWRLYEALAGCWKNLR